MADAGGRLEKGRVIFFNGAVESNAPLTGWPVYAKAGELAGVKRRVRCSCRDVGLTEHVLPNGEAVVVAINYTPLPVTCTIECGAVVRVFHGLRHDKTWTIPANDAVVFLVQ